MVGENVDKYYQGGKAHSYWNEERHKRAYMRGCRREKSH